MKQEELYRHLKELADKFGITFSEKSFRGAGINVNSGLCKIEGKLHFFMDKHKRLREKTVILAECLLEFPVDDIYIPPKVREFIEKQKTITFSE